MLVEKGHKIDTRMLGIHLHPAGTQMVNKGAFNHSYRWLISIEHSASSVPSKGTGLYCTNMGILEMQHADKQKRESM